MSENTRDLLNRLYASLYRKMLAFVAAATQKESKVTSGFYNGHYHKSPAGQYEIDEYPIPVVSLMGLCDIEIDFDGTTITAKLSKDQVLSFDWTVLRDCPFEIYGVEEYLTDYGNAQTVDQIGNNIRNSDETEFFVTFSMPKSADADAVIRFCEQLQAYGFYY